MPLWRCCRVECDRSSKFRFFERQVAVWHATFKTGLAMHRLTVLAFLFASALPVWAQEFTVYTTVRAASEGVPTGPVLSRSNTILHAGRSYDHMEEVGEVVICDPTKRSITLLHRGEVGTRLAFEELAQYLNVGRNETQKYADEISTSPEGVTAANALRFQLDPVFNRTQTGDRLVLEGTHWRYDVELADEDMAGYASRYADYADIAARLNFVLHPQSFYPAVRESLNSELRNAQRVPIKVNVTANVGNQIELVAEHRYRWKLEDFDRRQVKKFNELASAESVEWVNFREYQTRVLRGY